MKPCYAAALYFGLLTTASHAALNPGDIVFTLFDADQGTNEGDEQLAFLALTDIPGSEEVYFTDEEWDNADTFETGEGALLWTAPVGGVSKGTVISLATRNTLLTNFGTLAVADGGFDISANGETVFAYQGELSTPTTFLSAISTEGFLNTLEGTGLTDGVNAIGLSTDYDHAQYIGARFGEDSLADYLPLIAGDIENNWFVKDGVSQVDFLADTLRFAVGLPGDFNEDDVVDAADYALWRNHLGEDEAVLNGAGDGMDGVDPKDYDLWRYYYGASLPPSPTLHAAPAPAAGVLLCGATWLLFVRRRLTCLD